MSHRTLPLVLIGSLAASAALLPIASAQIFPAFSVDASPQAAEIFPGEHASFVATVGNPAIVARTASITLVSELPAGWTYNFTRDSLQVPANGTNTTLLTVFVPADSPATVVPVTFEAADSGTFARKTVNVTVKERPVAFVEPPAAPALTLSVSAGDSATSGETAQGALTITSADARSVTLAVTIAPAHGWAPSIPAADQNRILLPGATTNARLEVAIPPLTENASRDFVVSVRATTADGADEVLTATWSVLGIAPPAPVETTPTPPSTNVPATTTTGASTSGTPASLDGPNLDVYVEPLEFQVPANSKRSGVVHLINTGDTPLTITLAGSPPSSWRPFTFDTDIVELAPGDRAAVGMEITAPANLPPGGSARASVTAIDDGFVRQASFMITTIVGEPVDETEAATVEAPSAPDGGAPVSGSVVLLGVGLAAVGGAAAIVASRPLREKLLWGAAGLYTRLARPDVLGHEDREKLYRLVETTPGIHFHALQRDLAWNTGTLTYHLRVLERHGFVVSRRDGLYRRFYLSGAAPRKETFENQGPTGLRADVLDAVKSTPGISQSDLALGLGANKQTVNYHVKALERAGTIRVEKRGRDTYLFPGSAPAEPGKAEA